MTNKERLDKIIDLVFKYENRSHLLVSTKDVNDIIDCKTAILQDLEKLGKIKAIIHEANDKINETTDPVLVPFWMSKAFHEINEVLNNE